MDGFVQIYFFIIVYFLFVCVCFSVCVCACACVRVYIYEFVWSDDHIPSTFFSSPCSVYLIYVSCEQKNHALGTRTHKYI